MDFGSTPPIKKIITDLKGDLYTSSTHRCTSLAWQKIPYLAHRWLSADGTVNDSSIITKLTKMVYFRIGINYHGYYQEKTVLCSDS